MTDLGGFLALTEMSALICKRKGKGGRKVGDAIKD